MLEIEAHANYYSKLLWLRSDQVKVTVAGFESSQVSIPMSWLASSGDETFQLVFNILQNLVNEPGSLKSQDGKEVDPSGKPHAGQYNFLPSSKSTFRNLATCVPYTPRALESSCRRVHLDERT